MRSSFDLAPRSTQPKRELAKRPQNHRRGAEQGEAEPVEGRLVAQVDQAGEAAAADVEPVVAAIGLEARGDVVDELREGQRDHDEVDAARAQRQRADQRRPQRPRRRCATGHCSQPLWMPLGRQDADGIAADAEEHGVAEAHQPAIAQDHVEADRGDRPDDDARADRQQVALVEGLRQQRQRGQDDQQQRGDEAARRAQSSRSLTARCPNRPVGRHTSTPAITT